MLNTANFLGSSFFTTFIGHARFILSQFSCPTQSWTAFTSSVTSLVCLSAVGEKDRNILPYIFIPDFQSIHMCVITVTSKAVSVQSVKDVLNISCQLINTGCQFTVNTQCFIGSFISYMYALAYRLTERCLFLSIKHTVHFIV